MATKSAVSEIAGMFNGVRSPFMSLSSQNRARNRLSAASDWACGLRRDPRRLVALEAAERIDAISQGKHTAPRILSRPHRTRIYRGFGTPRSLELAFTVERSKSPT